MAILSAIVIVLQIFCSFVRFGPVSITLALVPIIIGGAKYGPKAGAFLGTVFGIVVFLVGVLGWDGGFVMMLMGINAPVTVLICVGKGLAAGFVSALVYKLFARKSAFLAVILAGILCPLVNTGLFILCMLTFFMPLLNTMAEGTSVFGFILVGFVGWNFVAEFFTTLFLSSATDRIIRISKKIG